MSVCVYLYAYICIYIYACLLKVLGCLHSLKFTLSQFKSLRFFSWYATLQCEFLRNPTCFVSYSMETFKIVFGIRASGSYDRDQERSIKDLVQESYMP